MNKQPSKYDELKKDDYWDSRAASLSDIVHRNKEFRSPVEFSRIYMAFDHSLFFGDDAVGDQFVLAIHAEGIVHKPDIYCWEHETDARAWFASACPALRKETSRG